MSDTMENVPEDKIAALVEEANEIKLKEIAEDQEITRAEINTEAATKETTEEAKDTADEVKEDDLKTTTNPITKVITWKNDAVIKTTADKENINEESADEEDSFNELFLSRNTGDMTIINISTDDEEEQAEKFHLFKQKFKHKSL